MILLNKNKVYEIPFTDIASDYYLVLDRSWFPEQMYGSVSYMLLHVLVPEKGEVKVSLNRLTLGSSRKSSLGRHGGNSEESLLIC